MRFPILAFAVVSTALVACAGTTDSYNPAPTSSDPANLVGEWSGAWGWNNAYFSVLDISLDNENLPRVAYTFQKRVSHPNAKIEQGVLAWKGRTGNLFKFWIASDGKLHGEYFDQFGYPGFQIVMAKDR